jgi:hypothetical protein
MKSNSLKVCAIVFLMTFMAAGVSLAGDDRGHSRGHGYGPYKHGEHHHYHHGPPRPVYVEHHYRPVIVERRYYPAPVYYAPAPPPPCGFFFGMSVANAGSAFSFGLSGR